MRVQLRVGSTTYVLAGVAGTDERENSSASDIRISANTQLQTVPRTRATASTVYDRLNLTTTISFSTTRKFASAEAAEQWALDYDKDFGREGILWLIPVNASTGAETKRYMNNAVVAPPQRSVAGCTVFLSYTVTGGAITTS